jgi:hypothetical protein
MRELARLRSEVVACPKCGRETFLEDAHSRKCANPNCDATVGVYMGIEVPLGSIESGRFVPYVIPVAHDSRIYKCQTGEIDPQHALDCTVRMFVERKILGAVAMRNVSDRAWRVKVDEDVFEVGPGRAIYAGENRELLLGDGEQNPLVIRAITP